MISLDAFLLDTEKADLNRNLASRPRQYNDAFGREGELTSGSNGAGRRATTRVTLRRLRNQHQSAVLRKAPLSGPDLSALNARYFRRLSASLIASALREIVERWREPKTRFVPSRKRCGSKRHKAAMSRSGTNSTICRPELQGHPSQHRNNECNHL
jgi:hypothetical protein